MQYFVSYVVYARVDETRAYEVVGTGDKFLYSHASTAITLERVKDSLYVYYEESKPQNVRGEFLISIVAFNLI